MKNKLEFFQKNGYLLLKNFLPKEEVATVLKDAKEVFFKQFIKKGYLPLESSLVEISEELFNNCLYRLFDDDIECLTNCGKQAQHLISLHRLSLTKNITEILAELGLKTPVISTRPVLFFNHPKLGKKKVYYEVEAHQDWGSMQGSLNSIVIWVPLIDIDISLGALEIIPKSHLFGLRTDHIDSGFRMVSLSEDENKDFISVEVSTGDVLIFSSFLIHKSGENSSSKPRWSCHFRYNDLDDKTFIDRKYAHAYIYKPVDELITKGFPNVQDLIKIFKK